MLTLDFGLATLNASLNGLSALCLFAGRYAILRQRREAHRRLMTAAFTISALFLVSYLTRVALTGTHRYPGHGFAKALYLAVLLSHMVLATATPFLAGRAIFLAWRGRFAEHRRIVRFAFPIWGYVSVTGVLVYLMLYHFA